MSHVETLTTGVELTKSGRLSRKGGDTNVDYFKQLLLDAPGRFARTTAAQAPIRARAPVAEEELQFIGSELPSYIELSATNSQYTMTPQSCVGKMDCNPKNGEKVVGTSEWPPAEWTRV